MFSITVSIVKRKKQTECEKPSKKKQQKIFQTKTKTRIG